LMVKLPCPTVGSVTIPLTYPSAPQVPIHV
jgi:hypothetical protein